MKISTEIDEILRKPDRTNGGMAAKTSDPSKSRLAVTNEVARQTGAPSTIGWAN
jgi:hypothetical protein